MTIKTAVVNSAPPWNLLTSYHVNELSTHEVTLLLVAWNEGANRYGYARHYTARTTRPLAQAYLGIHPELECIITRSFEKDRELGYQSAEDLHVVLKRAQKMLDEQATSLWRVSIDETTGQTFSQPEPISMLSPYCTFLTISRDGKHMVYVNRTTHSNIVRVPFNALQDKNNGTTESITQHTRSAVNPALSPDGTQLAFFTQGDPQFDIFVTQIDSTDYA